MPRERTRHKLNKKKRACSQGLCKLPSRISSRGPPQAFTMHGRNPEILLGNFEALKRVRGGVDGVVGTR